MAIMSKIGLSHEFIIPPGEILKDEIISREMTQEELAQRCGVSAKFISEVINGKKGISVKLANSLEYALGIDATFWSNLQSNYDQELYDFEHAKNISPFELSVLKDSKFKKVISYLQSSSLISDGGSSQEIVISLRKFFRISDLTLIPNLNYNNMAFRVKNEKSINAYVMFAWLNLCRIKTENISSTGKLDRNKLISFLPSIKALMFLPPDEFLKKLESIFCECGISFALLPHFTGAPVQGYIQDYDDKTLLCMTIRGAWADIFWFTLFHEIAHILNNDYNGRMVDFKGISDDSNMEKNADKFAADILINPTDYQAFVAKQYFNQKSINAFANTQGVCPFIVIGRLQNDNFIDYQTYPKDRYKWAD